MKFYCTCGNVINGTVTSKGLCKLYTKHDYVQWIKYLCEVIPYKEYDFKCLHTFYCEECMRYYVYVGDDLYVFKICPVEMTMSDDYESHHLLDEFESGEIVCGYDNTQKINETIESNFTLLPQTRMMNISFAEKKAYIENLDGNIETYVVEKIVKNT